MKRSSAWLRKQYSVIMAILFILISVVGSLTNCFGQHTRLTKTTTATAITTTTIATTTTTLRSRSFKFIHKNIIVNLFQILPLLTLII